jgi:hypothetical protein
MSRKAGFKHSEATREKRSKAQFSWLTPPYDEIGSYKDILTVDEKPCRFVL